MNLLTPLIIGGLSLYFLTQKKSNSINKIIPEKIEFEDFIVFPKMQNKTSNAPLLICLHGRGGSEESLKYAIPKDFNGKIMFIRSNKPNRLFYIPRLKENNENLAKEITKAGDELYTVIKKLKNEFGSKKVIVFGFSQGASLALYLASKGLVDKVLAFSGSLPPSLRPIDKKYTVLKMYHGNKDTTVPFELGIETYDSFKNAGYDVEFQTSNRSHIKPPVELAEEYLK